MCWTHLTICDQHASSAAAEKSCQDFYHISISAESLTESEAIIKWACESSAWQNENSDQCFYLYYSFYLKCHLCQCMSDLQCSYQISISSWNSYLTFIIIRKTEK